MSACHVLCPSHSVTILVQSGPDSQSEPGKAHKAPSTPSRPSSETQAETPLEEGERVRRKRTPNWKGKAEVLEQVNELIAELDGIAGSIASQVYILLQLLPRPLT